MSSSFRVPTLSDPNTVVRLARNREERAAANELVFRNYVNLYWPDDDEILSKNKYLNSEARHVFVAVAASRVIGTMSVIEDSEIGLPSDGFCPGILRSYRDAGQRLAEISCFAVDQTDRKNRHLMLFLIKFLFQYAFYYTELDRLIASCRPKHADFYEERLCFEKLTQPAPYAYAGNVSCQLVTLDLGEMHSLLSERYAQCAGRDTDLYRFLLLDDHPMVQLPGPPLRRRAQRPIWVHRPASSAVPLAV